jgi:ATP-dependent helicase/nuclease subunit A
VKRPGGIVDAEARRRAATDFEVNLVVSAAAGTGKTSLLVERILNAVGRGGPGLDAMAAVTFTRKAAAEMRSRLAGALERLRALALADAPPQAEGAGAEDVAERSWAWLRNERGVPAAEVAARALASLEALDRFNVSTIHAFCGEILRSYPVEAGVDPGFRQDEGAALEEIFEREWPDFLDDELGPEAPRAAAWERALELHSMDDLRQAARALADFGMPAPDEWRERCEDPRAALAALTGDIASGAQRLLDLGLPFAPGFRKYLEAQRDLALAFLEGRWRGGETPPPDAEALETLEKSVPDPGTRVQAEAAEQARVFARSARVRLRALARLNEEASAALLEPLRAFVQRFRDAYLRAGWVSYDGLLALTRDLLRRHVEVRRALQARFRHLLVDEFQDTSPVQYEILFLLAEEESGAAARDAWEVRLAPGRLFIVGDPKQSIYRFLKADITAYARAVEKVRSQGGAVLRLSANFRSLPPLISAVNRLFEAEFPLEGDDYQPEYQALQARRDEAEAGPLAEIWSTGSDPLGAPERRQAEARAIASWIARHAGDGRPVRLSQVAVLFRATTDIGEYLEELRAAGVPLVAEGAREFLERAEVRHLRALLSCLARPHDPVAVAAALRSPVGAVSDRDLFEHARAGGAWDLASRVPAASPAAVRRTLGWLRALRREVGDLPPEEQVLIALERSRLEIVEASHPDGAQSLANLRRYALSVAEAARSRGSSLEQAIAVVEARARPGVAGVEESPLADETLEAVRVLTVHKAKGMEFDVVIVPDLCRGEPAGRAAGGVEIDRARARGGGLALRTRRWVNAWRILHDHEEELHERAEALRTLYVACTRARRRLILLAGPAGAADGRRRWPAALRRWGYRVDEVPVDAGSLDAGVAHRDASRFEAVKVESPETPDVRAEVARFVEASARARAAARDWERHPSGLVESAWERQEAAEGPPASLAQAPAVVLGRVIHQALERWDGRGDGCTLLQEAVRRQTTEAGIEARAVEREAEALWERVRGSPLAALLREGEVRGREVPILMEEDGTVWRGSLDLLYRTREGEWVVADYKTEDPGADPEDHARRYLPQLRVYARALERALGARPRAEIFWVRKGTFTRFRPEDLEGPLD